MAESGSKAEHKLQPVVVRVNEELGRAVATVGAEICSRVSVNGVEVDLVSVSRLLYRVERKGEMHTGSGERESLLGERQKFQDSSDGGATETVRVKVGEGEDHERKADEPDLRFSGIGNWHLVSLDCIYAHDSLTASIPGESINLDAERLKQYRSSYRCLSYVLEEKGFPVRKDLPGDDEPGMVTDIYGNAFRWLERKWT